MIQKQISECNVIQKIKSEIETITTTHKAATFTQIANRYYRKAPNGNIDMCWIFVKK
jgi:phage FluMu protein Com